MVSYFRKSLELASKSLGLRARNTAKLFWQYPSEIVRKHTFTYYISYQLARNYFDR